MARHEGAIADRAPSERNQAIDEFTSPDEQVFRAAARYRVDADIEFPGDGKWPHQVVAFDSTGIVTDEFNSRWGTSQVLRVVPHDRDPWIGFFPAGGIGGTTGAFLTPSPELLCVIVNGLGFLVDVTTPEDGATILGDSIHQVVAASKWQLLLLASFTDILAIGTDATTWKSDQLALDDVTIIGLEAGSIRCSGYFSTGTSEFVVDPYSGVESAR